MHRAVTGITLLLLSFATNAAMYQCKDASGAMSFQDTPCSENSETLSERKQPASTAVASKLAKLVYEIIDRKGKSDPEFKSVAEGIAKLQALKVYMHKSTIRPYISGCRKISPKTGKRIEAAYKNYLSTMSDYLEVGESLARQGFKLEKPVEATRTPSEIRSDISQKVRELENKFAHITPTNRLALHRECDKMIDGLKLMAKRI